MHKYSGHESFVVIYVTIALSYVVVFNFAYKSHCSTETLPFLKNYSNLLIISFMAWGFLSCLESLSSLHNFKNALHCVYVTASLSNHLSKGTLVASMSWLRK